MNISQINQEQLLCLFEVCEEQGVIYYDVQVELVDHLASQIEEKLKARPDQGFEDILDEVLLSFGASGFYKIQKCKEEEMSEKYNRILRAFIHEYYSIPRIVLTVCFSLLLFGLFRVEAIASHVAGFFFIGISFFMLFYHSYWYSAKMSIKEFPGKSFLIEKQMERINRKAIKWISMPFSVFLLISYGAKGLGYHLFPEIFSNVYVQFGMAFFIIFYLIRLWASHFYLPRRIKDDFIRDFPQFVKS